MKPVTLIISGFINDWKDDESVVPFKTTLVDRASFDTGLHASFHQELERIVLQTRPPVAISR
jgi:hypothetical protein